MTQGSQTRDEPVLDFPAQVYAQPAGRPSASLDPCSKRLDPSSANGAQTGVRAFAFDRCAARKFPDRAARNFPDRYALSPRPFGSLDSGQGHRPSVHDQR